MMNTRRQFMAVAAAGAALAGTGPALGAERSSAARRLGGSLSRAEFEALTDQMFNLRDASAHAGRLRLVAVRQGASHPRLEQFTLVLRGTATTAVPGGLYRLEHARSGGVTLRLDPSGQDDQGTLYRADFSLLV